MLTCMRSRLPNLTTALALAAALQACGGPPSWDQLLAARIREQEPRYEVVQERPGQLLVRRPGLPEVRVDVDAIARFCQRGPKDCDYAIDQMLLSLRAP